MKKKGGSLMEKYLFIGAHPDDIEFGAGATLAKAVEAGIDCHVLVLSDCHESLASEFVDPKTLVYESQSALKVLGVKGEKVTFFTFPVRNFPRERQRILQTLVEKARVCNYSRIYVPASSDVHQDHHVVSTEALRAFKFSTILGYELPWNSFGGEFRSFSSLEMRHVEQKNHAIREFVSQRNRFYSGPEQIEITLKFRGLQINAQYAEAFEVLRWVEN